MSDILVFTNCLLCKENFLDRIKKISEAHPGGIVLREKNLSEDEYMTLAKSVLAICQRHATPCILHNFVNVAKELNCKALHLPLHILRTISSEKRAGFTTLGASCHSVEDATEAEKLKCTYITVGHIFDTDCKKGLSGRGIEFLKKVCKSVSIPVYAIGGINSENITEIRKAGARGACVMSGAMTCENIPAYLAAFQENKNEV